MFPLLDLKYLRQVCQSQSTKSTRFNVSEDHINMYISTNQNDSEKEPKVIFVSYSSFVFDCYPTTVFSTRIVTCFFLFTLKHIIVEKTI